jgi:hypothetical protein
MLDLVAVLKFVLSGGGTGVFEVLGSGWSGAVATLAASVDGGGETDDALDDTPDAGFCPRVEAGLGTGTGVEDVKGAGGATGVMVIGLPLPADRTGLGLALELLLIPRCGSGTGVSLLTRLVSCFAVEPDPVPVVMPKTAPVFVPSPSSGLRFLFTFARALLRALTCCDDSSAE